MVDRKTRRPSRKQQRALNFLNDGRGYRSRNPTCGLTGKVKFNTQEAADLVLHRRRSAGYGECRSYKCHRCGTWHLTSSPQRTEVRA